MINRGKLVAFTLLTAICLWIAVLPAYANSEPHRLGCKPSSKVVLQKQYNASYLSNIRLVRSAAAIDWSANMPTPGDQGQQGSCVAWSTGYNYKSYQEQVQHDWGLGTTHDLFSPAYIYNQIDGGQDNGAAISDALNLLVNQGCDTLDDMPYNDQDCTTQPTSEQRQRASYFPSQSWTPIFQNTPDIDDMKSALSNGPIVAGTSVYWSAGWETSGNIAQSDVSGSSAGGHAICIVGYDDSHQTDDGSGAFKFINSWGTGWGNYGGYGWISYSYAQNNFFEAEAMYDKTATDTYSLSGTVVDSSQQPLAGVTIAFAKQGGTDPVPAAVTTDNNGKWSQPGFEEGTPYQLTPDKANYTFSPASQNFSYDSMQPETINIQAGGGSQTSSITVTAPAGGASWQAGSTQQISWKYTGNPGSAVGLVLLNNGAVASTISSSTAIGSNGSGSYSWAIPSGLAAGSAYAIQVTSTNTTSCSATSNSFTISAPAPPPSTSSITVTAPAGGASWQAGSTQQISWKYTGNPGSAVGLVLLNNGAVASTISSSTAIGSNGSGSYSWAIPSGLAAGSAYAIQVTSTSTASCSATSNSFTISAPAPPPSTSSITVTAPAGGASWQAGSTQQISWKYTGNPGSAVGLVLLNNGAVASTISSGTAIGSNGSGSYSWAIPSGLAAGSAYAIQVTSTSTASCSATSNSFTISAPAPPPSTSSITVTYPTSGAIWYRGQYNLISWKYTGNPGSTVRIDLLRGGRLYTTIAYETTIGRNGTGNYSWHVSFFQATGSNFQVRLTSNSNPGLTSTSGYFYIGYGGFGQVQALPAV